MTRLGVRVPLWSVFIFFFCELVADPGSVFPFVGVSSRRFGDIDSSVGVVCTLPYTVNEKARNQKRFDSTAAGRKLGSSWKVKGVRIRTSEE